MIMSAVLYHLYTFNCNGGVMVSVPVSGAVDRRVKQFTEKSGICCFSAKHTALTRKRKDWFLRNQDDVSEWSKISTRRLMFCASV